MTTKILSSYKLKSGKTIHQVDEEGLLKRGETQADIDAAFLAYEAKQAPLKVRNELQRKVIKRFSLPSLVGINNDIACLAFEGIVIDILAVDGSAQSSIKTKRIELHEELHGVGSWASTVEHCQQWFDGRKAKAIVLPFDAKGGLAAITADIIATGMGVVEEIAPSHLESLKED